MTSIPLSEITQVDPDAWIDCTIGGLVCPCGGYVGQLDAFGDPGACDSCGAVFVLRVTVEMGAPAATGSEGGGQE